MAEPVSDQKQVVVETVTFHHKRNGLFRVVHADGAWGGANTSGIVYLTFYGEHPALPTSVTYPLDSSGEMKNLPQFVGDEGLQREMEISIALTIPAAMQVRATLDAFIKAAVGQMQLAQKHMDEKIDEKIK